MGVKQQNYKQNPGGFTFKVKNLLLDSKFFSELSHIERGDKNENVRVILPERIPIHLNSTRFTSLHTVGA